LASLIIGRAKLPGDTERDFGLFQLVPRVKEFPPPPLALTGNLEEEMRDSLGLVNKSCHHACSQSWTFTQCIWLVCDHKSIHRTHTQHQLVHLLVSYAYYGWSCRHLYLGIAESKGRGAARVLLCLLCGEK